MPIMKVEGMHCQNCVKAVTEAVSALPGAKGVEVSLEKGQVKWDEMGVSEEKVKEAIEDIGFEAHCCHCACDK
ncbi:MAG TPA: heavy-metal-associated domain-containing protein [Candidatus Aphodousia faecipullorum]|nr:heavy-metal-associated domain-containing protein [Candidatus Aphodousia faecipullorum]